MDMIKSTVMGPAVCESVSYAFYIFCLSTAHAMNHLIIACVSREEWSTATKVIETNYKASNLIPISLAEGVIFYTGYTTGTQNFPQSTDTGKRK